MSAPPAPSGTGPRMMILAGAATAVLEDDVRADLTAFVHARRAENGGFRGRAGGGDLYYAAFGFALRRLLGEPPDAEGQRYVESFGAGGGLDLVHLVALIRARALAGVENDPAVWTAAVGRFAVPDGGFRAAPTDPSRADLYACFLAMLAHDELGVAWPAGAAMVDLVAPFRTIGGGYAGSPGGAGLATLTAAAVALLRRGGMAVPDETAAWLLACRDPRSGGFRAAPNAPAADLLSTAVVLHALHELDATPREIVEPAAEYVQSRWHPEGGFLGHADDRAPDVEYTWYGLLALGCLLAEM